MDAAIAKAAVDVAHAQGKPVFAHPQNKTGVEAVIAAGVDVLAHTVPGQPGYTPEQLARFKSQGIALIPTLSLFAKLPIPAGHRCAAGRFRRQPAQSIFGQWRRRPVWHRCRLHQCLRHLARIRTDAPRAFGERQVLASLTTNPAAYFKAAKKGRVEKGFDADLVVLDGDPMADVSNLAKVAYTIRAGKVIYQKP